MSGLNDLINSIKEDTPSSKKKNIKKCVGKFQIPTEFYSSEFKIISMIFDYLEFIPWSATNKNGVRELVGYSHLFDEVDDLKTSGVPTYNIQCDSHGNIGVKKC